MSKREPTPDGGYSETFSVEDALLEKSRLEALQQTGSLSEEDAAMLDIISQWLAHHESHRPN
jgi:hypothetical protein